VIRTPAGGHAGRTEAWIVLGGASPLGCAITAHLLGRGERIVVVDTEPPPYADPRVSWLPCDVLLEDVELPPGPLVLLSDIDGTETPRPWAAPYRTALPVARLLPQLRERDVTLISSVAVYGVTQGLITEDSAIGLPVSPSALQRWCARAVRIAEEACPPWRAAPLCQGLVGTDDLERWAYPLSYRASEILLELSQPVSSTTRVLRVGEVLGVGHTGPVATLARHIYNGQKPVVRTPFRGVVPLADVVRAATAQLPGGAYNLTDMSLSLTEISHRLMKALSRTVPAPEPGPSARWTVIDSSRVRRLLPRGQGLEEALIEFAGDFHRPPSAFAPPVQVVTPPRPENPALIAQRQGRVYASGKLICGNQWTIELAARLSELLCLDRDQTVVLTSSGTAALRLAVIAVMGERPGAARMAVVPSFTFAATGEFLRQLGYELTYCDIDAGSWTLSPSALRRTLASRPIDLVVCVDALGNPVDYDEVQHICRSAGVPLVADSAPSLGAHYKGSPVGSQAEAHAFSMSFAKVVSAGGAGGFAVVPADADLTAGNNWLRSSTMPEINAIVALDQIEHIAALLRRRRAVASVYQQYAADTPALVPQRVANGNTHSYVHWVIRIQAPYQRDKLAGYLEQAGVITKPYYSPPLHDLLPGSPPHDLPETLDLAREVLALPMSSEMTVCDAERVVSALQWAMAQPQSRTHISSVDKRKSCH
jgi:dTDP-4-amino-4,6-dideoxygalactose transaminase/nucleoside-diphosphate-sugar epimerase